MQLPPIFSPSKTRRSGQGTSSRSTSGAARSGPTQWKRHGTALPGWRELNDDRSENRRTAAPRASSRSSDGSFLERMSTVRFTLLILVLAALFTLYVGHVHATQRLLADLQEARATQHVLRLQHNRLKGAYDQKTGPSVIYERARALGLEEGVSYGPTIHIENE